MRHKVKRMLSLVLVMAMVFTLVPVESVSAETVNTEETITETSTEVTTESDTEAEITEAGTETTTELTTEQEETEAVSEAVTEQSTTEISTEITTPEATTEKSTETSMFSSMELVEETMEVKGALDDKAPLGVIIAAKQWGGSHYMWYVNEGAAGARHYIFCMEKGKAMKSGIFIPEEYSGTWGSAENTFRIAVALNYFKSKGGWSSEDGYVDTQYAIWNEGGTDTAKAIINYSYALWQLTEKNSERSSGKSSFSSKLTAIKESQTDTKAERASINATAKYCKRDDAQTGGYDINSTINLSGAAWKYFADSSNWGAKGITVRGCYDAEGKKLDSNVAKASVGKDGNLDVHVKQDDNGNKIADSEANAVTVILQAGHDYDGATSIKYLQTQYSSRTQTLTYDTTASSPAYFAIRVYTSTEPPEAEPTGIQIKKVDEFGNEVDGAVFTVSGYTSEGVSIFDPPKNIISGQYLDLDTMGAYYIDETQAPPGMNWYINQDGFTIPVKFTVDQKTVDGVDKLFVNNIYIGDGVVATPSEDGLSYTYTVTDTYSDGDAVLHKLGNIFVAYENGKFIYKKRDLEHVQFELHAAENIYAGDILIFSAGQLITNEVLNASPWNTVAGHNASISNETDSDGNMYFNNLPYGNYYVVETNTPYEGYWVSGSNIPFSINAKTTQDGPVQINDAQGDDVENSPVYASCLVTKKEKKKDENGNMVETDKTLADAEFTLYAHISNKNFDGYNLFTVDQTQPAVVSRKNGQEQTVSNQWIPLETLKTDENGKAFFNMQLPYGRYMVVETYPPADPETGELYALAEESYEFVHEKKDSSEFASGALFTHTFYDQKKSSLILIRKTGEVLADAETIQTGYGSYRKLKFEDLAVKDITFEIYDSEGTLVESLKTDENGEAASKDLQPGVYYVKETDNGGSMKLDAEPKRVVLNDSKTQLVQTKVVEFTNKSLDTAFKIYKTAEMAELSGQAPDGASFSDSIYQYTAQKVSGVVFGLFTNKDITNYDGTVIVKAGSCVGYCVTDENGVAECKEKLVTGDYYWKEIRTKDNTYIKDTGVYNFSIKLSGENIVKDLNQQEPLLNKKYKGSIKVIKTDGRSKEPLEGVTFTLYDQNKQSLGTFLTDENGEIFIGSLPIGTYYLQETETLAGYSLDDEMKEINLTRTNLNQVLKIKNNRNDTSITVKTSSTISGHGIVKTGDMIIRFVTMLLILFLMGMLSLMGLVILQDKRRMKKIMGRLKNIMMTIALLLMGIGIVVPAVSAQAASAETTEITDASVIIDGTIYRSNNCTTSWLSDNSSSYIKFETPKGSYCVRFEERINAEFYLIGKGFDESLTVPKNIQLSVTYRCTDTSGNMGDEKTIIISGNVTKILVPSSSGLEMMGKIIIPDDSFVRYIAGYEFYDDIGLLKEDYLTYNDILYANMYITSYNPNVSININYGYVGNVSLSTYNVMEKLIREHFMVYYSSSMGQSLRTSINVDDGSSVENKIIEPSYFTGNLILEKNGGTYTGSTVYNIGTKVVLSNPTRLDHRFCGWYTNKDFTGESILSTDSDGNYYLSAEETLAESITLYARWEYSATISRGGINYQIAADKSVSVVAGDYSGEIVIVDYVSYNGTQYPVTSISAGAFAGSGITSVTIPETVSIIEDGAFTGCNTLTDVYMVSMMLAMGDSFPKTVKLHAYATSEAYKQYEADGYTGTKVPYSSKITYVLNGGTNHPDNPEIYAWKSMLVLQDPAKDGCRFDGWYMDALFLDAARVESICEDTYKDIVLYAKFTQTKAGASSSDEVTGAAENDEIAENGKTSSLTKAVVTSVKLSNVKGKKLKITMKSENAAGYQIQYSTSKSFKKKLTKTVNTTKSSYTAKKLKKGKTYYVKVRAYSYDTEGHTVYGTWSKVKKVKVKK